MSIFYEIDHIPAHSVLLFNRRAEAVGYPRGDIRLGYCRECGFISNTAFDPGKNEYSTRYEATQGYSTTFNQFHERLARSLIERYDLHGKRVLEIGCGQGEFLDLLCRLGGNQGVGFDPAYSPERSPASASAQVRYVQDFYSERYADIPADFICCKMTLEHIHQTGDFIATVRRAIAAQPGAMVFFQVPNARYVFGDLAFWDVYYEHCSYFSQGSIARLFRRFGFQVLDLWTDYDDQYLMITARLGGGESPALPQEHDLEILAREIDVFRAGVPQRLAAWRAKIDAIRAAGHSVVLWGGGSKGVAFLTSLNLGVEAVEYVVDINPHKAGAFMPGSGQEIVAPGFLTGYRPDFVIVMNPIYTDEVRNQLAGLGLNPEILTVDSVQGGPE